MNPFRRPSFTGKAIAIRTTVKVLCVMAIFAAYAIGTVGGEALNRALNN